MRAHHLDEPARALFEASGDALFLFDPDTEEVLDANPAAERLTGVGRQELKRRPLASLLGSVETGLASLPAVSCVPGDTPAQDGFLLRDHGQVNPVPVQFTLSRLPVGTRVLGLMAARERRVAQAALEQQEASLRQLLASVSVGLWTVEIDGDDRWTHSYASPAVQRIIGWPAEHFLRGHERRLSTVHPDDRLQVEALFSRILGRRSEREESEYRTVWPDGTMRWVRVSVTVCGIGLGLRLDGVVTDVTARKQAEEARRASEERLQRIVETVADGILIVAADGRLVFANAATEGLLGLSRDELLRHTYFDPVWRQMISGVDGGPVPEEELVIPRVLRTGELLHGVERTLRRADGVQRVVSANVAPLRDAGGAVTGVVISFSDVTERKHAEEALRASEERYRLLFERNLAGVFRSAAAGMILDCNDSFAHILGYESRADVMPRAAADLYRHPDEREAFLARLRERGHLPNHEICLRRKDGSPVWVLENVSLLSGDDGPAYLEGTIVDITERKQAEEALRASEAKYRALLDNLEQSVFLKDRELRYVAANRIFCRGLGSEAEVVGRTDFDFLPRELAEKYRADDLRVLTEGRHLELEEEAIVAGKRRVVRTVKTPVQDGQGRVVGVLGILWDVTEQRHLEAQLRQAQKMEAVGQLAGGVAHDFNNLLTAILGNLSLLAAGMPPADPNRDLAAAAEKAALRAATLTSQLLGFSRQTLLRPQPINLNTVIDEVLHLLARTIDPRITLEKTTAPALWTVHADAGQMNQVLMNLCLNARDAMPQGGRLVLETENVVLSAEDVRLRLGARPGEFVRLSVLDTGHGMVPEVRARIFDPFFTTKGPGKGTGLGLAMVFGIVQQHRGWIDCASTPGRGTRFDLYLPRGGDRAEDAPRPAPERPTGPGRETVLLVDDEPLIRELGRTILQRSGYRVLLAGDGLQALDVYQQHPGKIDLVLLDLTMPHLSGRDTYRRLVQIDSRVRVLFASGYSAEHLVDGSGGSGVGFVGKPYSPEELVQRVRETLDGNEGNEPES